MAIRPELLYLARAQLARYKSAWAPAETLQSSSGGLPPEMMGMPPSAPGGPPPGMMGLPPEMMGMPPSAPGGPPPGMMGLPPEMMGMPPSAPGGPPPGMMGLPPEMMGMPPEMMGMPPSSSGGAGAAPITEEQIRRIVQEAISQGGTVPAGQGAASARRKVDIGTELFQIKRLLALIIDALGLAVPADTLLGPDGGGQAGQPVAAAGEGRASANGGEGGNGSREAAPMIPPLGGIPPMRQHKAGSDLSHSAALISKILRWMRASGNGHARAGALPNW